MVSYWIDDVEACAPEELPITGTIELVIGPADPDTSSGCPRILIAAADRDELIAYVAAHWGGHGDAEWFARWILARIQRHEGGDPA